MLDEWLRLGVVHLSDADEVELNTDAFVPQQGFDEKAFYFAHNLHDHASAAVHNMIGNGTPWLERSVHYDALQPPSIAELRSLAAKVGMDALLEVNRRAMALEEPREADVRNAQRFTFGIYFYSEQSGRASTSRDDGEQGRD